MLDAPDGPRENLEPFFGDGLSTDLAQTVSAMGHAIPSLPYVLQHRKEVLLSGHRSEPFDRHRGSLTDPLAERDGADLFDR